MWGLYQRPDGVHLAPLIERHEMHVACWCVPRIIRHDGAPVPVVLHRDHGERRHLRPDVWHRAA